MSKKSTFSKSGFINIAIVGFKGCGKSAILVRFFTGRFIVEYSPDLTDEVQTQTTVDGQTFTLHVKDYVDSDDANELVFQWADIVLNVFSITSRSSYYRTIEIARTYLALGSGAKTSVMLLVGNKIDLADLRLVQLKEAQDTAESLGLQYTECTVIYDTQSVQDAFLQSIRIFLSCSHHSSYYFAAANFLKSSTLESLAAKFRASRNSPSHDSHNSTTATAPATTTVTDSTSSTAPRSRGNTPIISFRATPPKLLASLIASATNNEFINNNNYDSNNTATHNLKKSPIGFKFFSKKSSNSKK